MSAKPYELNAANHELVCDAMGSAVQALHGVMWAAEKVRWATGTETAEAEFDAFVCLLETLLPAIGCELESAINSIGGLPVGYFKGRDEQEVSE